MSWQDCSWNCSWIQWTNWFGRGSNQGVFAHPSGTTNRGVASLVFVVLRLNVSPETRSTVLYSSWNSIHSRDRVDRNFAHWHSRYSTGCTNETSLADLWMGEGATSERNFFIFMQISQKIGQTVDWRPPLRNPGSATASCPLVPCGVLCHDMLMRIADIVHDIRSAHAIN